MRKLLRKVSILYNSIIGIVIKLYYDIVCGTCVKPLCPCDRTPQIIVSLTSYGRRVSDTVYYTILSILKQTMLPDRIILWLDDNWDDNTIPNKLKQTRDYGVEIYYYKDIKSYKKLIPTLKIADKDIIITIDDDVIYNKNLISSLYRSYLQNTKAIHCTQALRPKLISSQDFDSYINWDMVTTYCDNEDSFIFPVGVGAVLYPPQSLHLDVLREELFTNLCPNADDIWFWIMAKLNKTEHIVVKLKPRYYSFDAIYQLLHKHSALTHTNRMQNKNDIQLRNVIKHYNLHFNN